MTREQVDDLVLAATIGIIVGGRVGFATFYERLIREPDAQLAGFAERTGLHMGQWLTLPLIALGVVLVVRAARRPALEVADVAGVPG
jgi:phosphatidylglycerol:prolipoprotein diacylglycerol transferase